MLHSIPFVAVKQWSQILYEGFSLVILLGFPLTLALPMITASVACSTSNG